MAFYAVMMVYSAAVIVFALYMRRRGKRQDRMMRRVDGLLRVIEYD